MDSNKTVRETILNNAKHAVCSNCDHQYGNSEDSFRQIAHFWSVYLHKELSACDVANMMILFKLSRNITEEPKLDNWVDIAGYAACGADWQCKLVEEYKDELAHNGNKYERYLNSYKKYQNGVVKDDED